MDEEIKTFIIASDEYMGVSQTMRSFKGTFRALVEDLLDVEDWDAFLTPEGDVDPNVPYSENVKTWPLSRLIEVFNEGNGDGQPYVMVWCLEEDKQVLG